MWSSERPGVRRIAVHMFELQGDSSFSKWKLTPPVGSLLPRQSQRRKKGWVRAEEGPRRWWGRAATTQGFAKKREKASLGRWRVGHSSLA